MPHTKKNFLIKCVFSLAAVSYDKIKKAAIPLKESFISAVVDLKIAKEE